MVMNIIVSVYLSFIEWMISQYLILGPCEGSGWVLWHPGALQGGCTIELGIEVCTVPSERYNHASVAFDDGAIYIYGGYSQRCADYCDDIWFFDIYLRVSLLS